MPVSSSDIIRVKGVRWFKGYYCKIAYVFVRICLHRKWDENVIIKSDLLKYESVFKL